MSRMGEFHNIANSGMRGPMNPMSGGSMDGFDRGGGTGRDKLLSGGMQSGKFAGVASTNISSVGKMPSPPAPTAGSMARPSNPSMGKGAGMRMSAFSTGSGGMGMKID